MTNSQLRMTKIITWTPLRCIVLMLVVASCIPQRAIAQESNLTPEQLAIQAIRELKDGVLIVRLTSNHRKLKALEDALAKDSDNTYLKKQLEDTQLETREENTTLIQAFTEKYDFSEVLFMYDTAMSVLTSGQQSGYFLTPTLAVSDQLALNGRPYLLLQRGNTDRSTTTGGESFSFVDARGNALQEPYFQIYKINNFPYIFNKIFNPSSAQNRNFTKIAGKISNDLKKFYLQTGGSFR